MDRWTYIKYTRIIDNIIELGPNVSFTSGSVLDETNGHVLSELRNNGTVTYSGKERQTHVNLYKVSLRQFEIMKKVQERYKCQKSLD
jgi:hypothetical protein